MDWRYSDNLDDGGRAVGLSSSSEDDDEKERFGD